MNGADTTALTGPVSSAAGDRVVLLVLVLHSVLVRMGWSTSACSICVLLACLGGRVAQGSCHRSRVLVLVLSEADMLLRGWLCKRPGRSRDQPLLLGQSG